MSRVVMLCVTIALAACSGGDAWDPPLQHWQDMSVRIETRPSPVREGMNEFLVIAGRQQRGFTSDLVVHIRTENSDWKQAIPDGALGVYRRALPVLDAKHDHLYVRLERNGQRGELMFALSPAGLK
ncbi:MAG TPA: hypothetical protein VNI58_00915 [Mariprofundaceae bacterium]|nr:hypothetical protein [Mariprofundaceae bacterium]